jgi:hypothetical protein
MTPKEKAEELIDKFKPLCGGYFGGKINKVFAKQCASIAVDEIIKAIDFDWMEVQNLQQQHRYWQEVKQEIENL